MRVSESDSFISEVTEEVRREKLFAALRRWGWLIGVVILLIVGGAAWREWSQARARMAAQAEGDAFRAALAVSDPAERAAALQSLSGGGSAPVVRLAEAGARMEAGDAAAAAATLAELASDGAAPEIYRDLAALQRIMALGPDLDTSERLAALDRLAAEEAPLRLLALEQRALLRLETGDDAGALADLDAILASPLAPEGLRGRSQQLAIAAGGEYPRADASPPEG
jgi:hypothetical protein